MKGAADYIPKKDGMVRITEFSGFWKITPASNGTVDLVYQFHTDPGGSIPDWMANMTSIDIPYFTLEKMKEQVK